MGASHKVTVRLPARDFTFEESVEILRSVLGRAGCPTCYSGVLINFENEVEQISLSVNEEGRVEE